LPPNHARQGCSETGYLTHPNPSFDVLHTGLEYRLPFVTPTGSECGACNRGPASMGVGLPMSRDQYRHQCRFPALG
jgi:hypothetical protein